ncbi:MAG TPA: hypothetical protein VG435_16735 [Acidimicrobiales bacterium]|jgi:hypothetical protein|nr:hypothetical protein [Acidimicrobiales bacterium]
MLTGPDDSPWHQLPTTFDHVGTSDPRFFDRLWFAASDGDGRSCLQFTIGVYQNMNVVDGGFVVVRDGRQHNLRVSRQLRPRYETTVGPMAIEVIEPLTHLRLTVGPNDGSTAAQLDWRATMPAQEENHHFRRRRGRVLEDYARYDQIGSVSGWVDVDGDRVEIDDWWACRDHSWGVRERVGIPEPRTGEDSPPSGSLFSFLFFSTATHGGHVQVGRHDGVGHLTAELTDIRTGETSRGRRVAMTAEFVDTGRPRRFSSATFSVEQPDGTVIDLEVTARGPAVAMTGLGYGGYRDGLGLGVYRGRELHESEIWDVSHPAVVTYPDGRQDRPVHRIQPVRVVQRSSAGTSEGNGSLTFIAEVEVDEDGRLREAG